MSHRRSTVAQPPILSVRGASRTLLSNGLQLAFGSALTLGASCATFAQDATPQDLGKVIVTGSNIPRADKETASPLQVITAEDMKKSGYTTVSEVLRDLTANGQGTLSQSFNGAFAAGGSGVSLRGLTVGATLVLIDGHRMAPYPLSDDGERPFVDISSIPFTVVDHIEILKDGASAIYGSDAIAGVVNIILKKNYKGATVTAEGGTSQHGGGTTKNASVTAGFGDLGSPLSGYATLEYRKQNEIRLNQRHGAWDNFNWTGQGGLDLRPGASNDLVPSPRLRGIPYFQVPGASSNAASSFAFTPGCTFDQLRASQCVYDNNWSQLQPATENINVLGRLNASFNSNWSGSFTASYFDSKAQQVQSPASIPYGSFAGNTAIGPYEEPSIRNAIDLVTVPANYPGNTLGVPAYVRALLPDRFTRQTDVDSKSARLVAELDGSVADWDIRAAAGFTKVVTVQTSTGYINYANLLGALNSPTDPLLLAGGSSAAAIASVSSPVRNSTADTLSFFEANVSHELMQLHGGPLGFAAGVTGYHKNLSAPDSPQAQDGSYATGSSYALGKESNIAEYAELRAPVIKTLELDGAVRHDHYNTYGDSYTPKAGFKFVPTPEFSVRGTFSRGFRAPSPTENGTSGSLFGFNTFRDPVLCPTLNADGSPNLTAPTNVPLQCDTGPTYLQVSNKKLQPEKSKSYTFGIILEPIKNWSTTIDYYKILISNQIVSAASLSGFDPAALGVRSNPQIETYGDGTNRLADAGEIQYVPTPYVNAQSTETSGMEFETRYRFNLPQNIGALSVDFMLTHILKYDLTLNGSTAQLAGTHGPAITSGDTGNPRDRAQLTFTYDHGPLSVSTTTNYVGRYGVTDPSNGINDCATALNAYNSEFSNLAEPPSQYCKVPSFTYTNLTARYAVSKGFSVHGTITNLFDREPPIDMATYGGPGINPSSNGTGAPYNPSLHQIGAVGRFFSVGAEYTF